MYPATGSRRRRQLVLQLLRRTFEPSASQNVFCRLTFALKRQTALANLLFQCRLLACLAACVLCTVASSGVQAATASQTASHSKQDSLDAYLASAEKASPGYVPTSGSLWNPTGYMSDMGSDSKARYVGDLVTINIAEATNSALQGSVQTARTFSASSSLAAMLGGTNSRAQNLFSPSSSQALNGKGQTALSTSLTTTLGASVVAVLPNGTLVIEARRDVEVTNQHQTLILRGIIRRDDLSPTNVVSSTAISHLEVTLQGKGVISDGTRPPNVVVRVLLRIFNF